MKEQMLYVKSYHKTLFQIIGTTIKVSEEKQMDGNNSDKPEYYMVPIREKTDQEIRNEEEEDETKIVSFLFSNP